MHRRARRTRRVRKPAASDDDPPDDQIKTPEQVEAEKKAAADIAAAEAKKVADLKRQKDLDDAKASAAAAAKAEARAAALELWGLDPDASDEDIAAAAKEHKEAKAAKLSEADKAEKAAKAAAREANKAKSDAEAAKKEAEAAKKEAANVRFLAANGVNSENGFELVGYLLDKALARDPKKDKEAHLAEIRKELPKLFGDAKPADTAVKTGDEAAEGTKSGEETVVAVEGGGNGLFGGLPPKVDMLKMSREERASYRQKYNRLVNRQTDV